MSDTSESWFIGHIVKPRVLTLLREVSVVEGCDNERPLTDLSSLASLMCHEALGDRPSITDDYSPFLVFSRRFHRKDAQHNVGSSRYSTIPWIEPMSQGYAYSKWSYDAGSRNRIVPPPVLSLNGFPSPSVEFPTSISNPHLL